MDCKPFLASMLTSLVLFPAGAAAFEYRRGYSEYWNLTGAERTVDLADRVEELTAELRKHQEKMAEHEKSSRRILEGLQYEKSTLTREREALDATVARNRIAERNMLSRMSLVGPPKHLKRWRLQKSLRNAQKLLAADKQAAYEDLERREELLARETDSFNRSYGAERRRLQRRESQLKKQITSLQSKAVYAKTDRRNVFLGSILKPEREDFLQPRRLRYAATRAQRAERLKEAVEHAQTDNYFTRVQPTIQRTLAEERTAEARFEQKIFENTIIESLGSNVSPEELKRLSLQKILQKNQGAY